ncbi:PREDICTED: histidine-containing phosphotransfer protein 2-like [Nicotiana attenuata]|uniref:histidine-containing phosphotransfer protein 2-like n=1 Tax=Nicotiana attenuata TaxID=49451 RepID=UPI0009055FFC|nr:PREDICTED: histidine-containing phosphotransfer protein 2-like [Nicotiana attenuata]
MDNKKAFNQKLLDRVQETMEVEDMECEKMDADVFSQQLLGDIYQSLENEVSNCQKMDKGALVQQVLDRIQSLEDEGLVDSYFQICYSLKEDNGPYFFLELIPSFLSDARTVMRDMAEALESPVVDFDVLIEHCIKLKGSSACLGACKITNVCSDFSKAVNKKSKDECLRLLRNINREYRDLQSKLESIMQLEKEIVSAERSES